MKPFAIMRYKMVNGVKTDEAEFYDVLAIQPDGKYVISNKQKENRIEIRDQIIGYLFLRLLESNPKIK